MKTLSRLGVGLVVVSVVLLILLTAELYYLFVYKRRLRRRASAISEAASSPSSSSRELLQLFCFKKPPSLASTYAQEPHAGEAVVAVAVDDEEETVEAQLMRLGSLVGPPRLLFTIKEETKEDLESEDGRSRCGRSRSLGELLHSSETPFMTPASSPGPLPLPPMDKSFNPLFESMAVTVSPPPKFQFLKDAEEKLYRRALAEEATRALRSPQPRSPAAGEEDGGYITIMVGKNNNRVIPLASPANSGGDQ
ncbi:hypothetical protein GUJ93_ZPchr0011g26885 [Zizania palustris]|uniref:Uncharacterized protein n=1 Tax=Zizania palustris TaxID=103762 RepID=A0A8J5WKW9_ZIZPA|nr:hypothetical protein GUJ93_ZPchr0011g26885 [Zizania palustris]